MLFIGPEAERRFGHRHFMNLTAVFTAPPEFTVLNGRTEIGRPTPICSPRKSRVRAGSCWPDAAGRSPTSTWHGDAASSNPVDGGGRPGGTASAPNGSSRLS